MTETLLVTGATGFIGGRLAARAASTSWLSSLWIGRVTPVDAGVARPLIEGLATPTVATDPSVMVMFDIEPISFDQPLRPAVAEHPGLATT